MKSFPDVATLRDSGMRGGSRVFELAGIFRYRSPEIEIAVPVGFVTDGASVPRIFWNIFSPFGVYFPAALIHDFLYSKSSNQQHEGLTRKQSDQIFLGAMQELGVGWLTRRTIYRAVRIGGWASFKKKPTDMTQSKIKELQRHVGTTPDGFWGRKSIAACKDHLRQLMPRVSPWPKTSTSALTQFYGDAGEESNLVNLPVAGLGVKYEGREVKTVRCHSSVSESLGRIIKQLSKQHPEVLADYNGCFNFRRMRGGSSYSLHAYGAAIDFLAGSNGNRTTWPGKASMPITVLEIFAREGWLPAGAFWSRDAMHFQATQ